MHGREMTDCQRKCFFELSRSQTTDKSMTLDSLKLVIHEATTNTLLRVLIGKCSVYWCGGVGVGFIGTFELVEEECSGKESSIIFVAM